ncbi:hypothetical protein GCM10020254_42360 [Streptomyces goshikiensis]
MGGVGGAVAVDEHHQAEGAPPVLGHGEHPAEVVSGGAHGDPLFAQVVAVLPEDDPGEDQGGGQEEKQGGAQPAGHVGSISFEFRTIVQRMNVLDSPL